MLLKSAACLLVCLGAVGTPTTRPPGRAADIHLPGAEARPDREYVGVELEDIEGHYRRQQQSMWCWASCAEMVLAHQGVSLPQDRIVRLVKGAGFNAPGNPLEMIRSTNHFLETEDGETAVVSGQFIAGAPLPNVLYNHLAREKPVILTYQSGPWMGHAVVLYGMEVVVHPERQGAEIEPVVLHVADPFAYRPTFDNFGNRFMAEDDTARFRRYAWRPGLGADPFPGVVSGAILVEATLR